MIEFNPAILASLYLNGYKYALYISNGDFGIIRPTKTKAPDDLIKGIGAYELRVLDIEMQEMSFGSDDFKFFVAEDIFDQQEKYNVLSLQ